VSQWLGVLLCTEERLRALIASLWLKEVERSSWECSEGAHAGGDKMFPVEWLGVVGWKEQKDTKGRFWEAFSGRWNPFIWEESVAGVFFEPCRLPQGCTAAWSTLRKAGACCGPCREEGDWMQTWETVAWVLSPVLPDRSRRVHKASSSASLHSPPAPDRSQHSSTYLNQVSWRREVADQRRGRGDNQLRSECLVNPYTAKVKESG